MKTSSIQTLVAAALTLAFTTATRAQAPSHYDELANMPFKEGYIAKDNVPTLLDESFFANVMPELLEPAEAPDIGHCGHDGRQLLVDERAVGHRTSAARSRARFR